MNPLIGPILVGQVVHMKEMNNHIKLLLSSILYGEKGWNLCGDSEVVTLSSCFDAARTHTVLLLYLQVGSHTRD